MFGLSFSLLDNNYFCPKAQQNFGKLWAYLGPNRYVVLPPMSFGAARTRGVTPVHGVAPCVWVDSTRKTKRTSEVPMILRVFFVPAPPSQNGCWRSGF